MVWSHWNCYRGIILWHFYLKGLFWKKTVLFLFLFFPWFYLFIIFNWKVIALQNFIVFCQVSTWISHSSLDINKDTSLKVGKIITGLKNTVQTFALIAIDPKTISDVSCCFDGDVRFCWDLNQQSELGSTVTFWIFIFII